MPGLVDHARIDEPGAKLDTLLEQLDEVLDEGHKVLVFSQFTSFLAILRRRLDEPGDRSTNTSTARPPTGRPAWSGSRRIPTAGCSS